MNYIGKEDAQLKLFEAIFPEKKREILVAVEIGRDRSLQNDRRTSHNRKINLSRLKAIFTKNQKNGRCVSRKNLETFGITDLIPRLEKIGRKVV